MNIKDCYKFVKNAKENETIKVSSTFLNKMLDCTKKGQKLCQGRCCKGHYNSSESKKVYVRYLDEEWNDLPNNIKLQLKPFVNQDKVVQNKNDICMLIDFCLKKPQYKPTECKLYPLTFNKHGRLILDHWAMFWCPNFKKGNLPVYKVLKDNLIDVFGEKVYKEIVRQCEGDIKKWM